MSFLLDTNVVSEWMKPRPNAGVIAWLGDVDEDQVFLSVITLAELRHGIERLAQSARRRQLAEWLEDDLPIRFEGRILDVDRFVADACGKLSASREAVGRRMQAMDALIAATARVHQLSIVTRNTSDFQPMVKDVINPWV